MLRKLITAAALLTLGTTAQAAIITHVVDQRVKVDSLKSHQYQHDLTEVGFAPGSMTAVSGNIQIEIWDDGCDVFLCLDELLPEVILVQIDKFDFDTGSVTFGTFIGGLEVKALAAINATGILDVTIYSLLGDFYVGQSTLTVATVPEPATLALLGGGLLAFGLGRRRKSRA